MRRYFCLVLLLAAACAGRTDVLDLGDGGSRDSGPVIDSGSISDAGEVACEGLDEAACAVSNCRVDVCPRCRADPAFAGCSSPTTLPPSCPALECPPCEVLSDDACRADPGCHGIYLAPDTECFCDAPGCCHEFVGCAEGRYADCAGDNLACRRMAPYCDGPYVISHVGTCYEGCALAEDCAP